EIQGQPVAAAVIVEAGHIEGPLVENIAVYPLVVAGPGDELVNVLVPGVIAGVEHHRLTLLGRGQPTAFVGEAAHGGALFGQAEGVEGIDLHNPALAVGLVAIVLAGVGAGGGGVETDMFIGAALGGFPAIAAIAGAHPIAAVLPGAAGFIDEIAGPVFLTGEVGTPGRVAVTAIVDGAPGHGALRAVPGFHQVATAHRAVDLHGGARGDAAVVDPAHQVPGP